MKTKYLNICNLSIFLFLYGCGGSASDEEITIPEENTANLTVSSTIQTRSVITQFASGDQMNLFVKTGSSISSNDYKTGVSASYHGNTWTISPTVELQNDVYVFASYPYSSSSDASQIPISITPQTDYLYSGSGVKVSGSSPNAALTMKHALPMIAFNIAKGNYTGEGKLTKITISGEGLYKTGTMNVANGSIVGKIKGDYIIDSAKGVETDGWKEDFPQMFCLPFNSDGTQITVTLTMDGKEWKTLLPKQEISGGMKYLFRMVLTSNGVMALADQTEIISLNKDTDQMNGGMVNELAISYQGTKAVLPVLSGAGTVSGVVYWGDGLQEAYSTSLVHTYSKDGDYPVLIQTIGATAVEFKDLECVEEIDLSGF